VKYTVEGKIEVAHGRLLLEGGYVEDELAALLAVGRTEHGGLADADVGTVRITVEPNPPRAY
jgi:hypothetical protein